MALFGPSRRLFQEASQTSRPLPARRRQVALFTGLSVAMLTVSRIDPTAFAPVSHAIIGITAPIAATSSRLISPVAATVSRLHATLASRHDLEHLRSENARLTQMAANWAALEQENSDLRRAANYVGTNGQSPFTARVIASSSGPLARTVVINAGRDQGIGEGAPVTDAATLVGRVIDVHSNTSSVMLLGDRLSRVPVQIGTNQIRAVLIGNGTDQTQLDFIASQTAVASGDLVTTSGLGGVFPRGLVIGTLQGAPSRWVIVLTPMQEAPTMIGVHVQPTVAVGASPSTSPANTMPGAVQAIPAVSKSSDQPKLKPRDAAK